MDIRKGGVGVVKSGHRWTWEKGGGQKCQIFVDIFYGWPLKSSDDLNFPIFHAQLVTLTTVGLYTLVQLYYSDQIFAYWTLKLQDALLLPISSVRPPKSLIGTSYSSRCKTKGPFLVAHQNLTG